MSVPQLPSFDAKAANNGWKTLRKADGSEFAVYGSESFVSFVQGLRGQRDIVARHDVQLNDHKRDIDRHTARLDALAQRVTALEDAPSVPFPASG